MLYRTKLLTLGILSSCWLCGCQPSETTEPNGTLAADFSEQNFTIIGTQKTLYNLKEPENADDPAVNEVLRSEIETYDPAGRRQRVEWRNPEGEVTLAFMELYEETDRPYGALYVEGGELSPTLESFEWSDDGRTRTVTYSKADGVPTSTNVFILDEDGREVERRYGLKDGKWSSGDTVVYDGLNEVSYTWSRSDGSAQSDVVYDNLSLDKAGNWIDRITIRNGTPTIREVRQLNYLMD